MDSDNAFETSGTSPTFEPLLRVEQAAELLGGMHPKTLMRLARNREVPAIKIGKLWYFRSSALNQWIDAQAVIDSRPASSVPTERVS